MGANFLLFYLYRVEWFYFVGAVFLAFYAIYDLLYMHVNRTAFLAGYAVSLPILIYRTFVVGVLPYSLLEASGVILIIVLVNRIKKSFGFADILVIAFMAFYTVQWKLLIGVYAAFILGAVAGIAYAIVARKKNFKFYIPFLPFLYIGFVFTVCFLL